MRAASFLARAFLIAAPLVVGGLEPGAAKAESAGPTRAADASPAPSKPAQWSDADGFPSVTPEDPVWGNRAAPVTLVVFSDLQCPFCAKHEETLEEMKTKYGPTQLRIVFKHAPLVPHKNARSAAIAAETIHRLGGSSAFFPFVGLAFADQRNLTPANFNLFAKQVGIEPKRITTEVVSLAVEKVDADLEEAKTVGVRGVPATFANGVFLSGFKKPEQLSVVIDEELARAAGMRNVPADKKYVRLSKAAKQKADSEKRKKAKTRR